MELLGQLFRRITPTRALELSSGKYETLFFGTMYRVTYLAGLSSVETGWLYFVYTKTLKITFFLLVIGEIWVCFDDSVAMHEKVDVATCGVMQFIALYRFINMYNNRESYKELATSTSSPHFDTSTPRRRMLVDYWARQNELYLKLLFALGQCTLIARFIYPLVDGVEYNLVIRTYIPISYETPSRYPFMYVLVMVMFWYISHFVMVTDMKTQAFLMHLLGRLAVLRDCFMNILEDCSVGFEGIHPNYLIYNKEFADKYTRRMGELVEQHQIILNQIMNLRDSLSRPMFFQFMVSGTLICFVGYETILTLTENAPKTVNSVLFLGFNIFEVYLICRWCDEITTQCEQIGEAIYFCGWEAGMSVMPGIKQTVKLVIARAQKPLTFTAGGLYELSLASFSSLVKTSYSALSLVLQMSHK